MLTVSLLVCTMIVLARANDNITAEVVPGEKSGVSSDAWSYFDGKEYLFVPTAQEWADAEKNCLSKNSHLAAVHSAEEYTFMQNLVRLSSGTDADTWIGGSDSQKKNLWLWSDGSIFDFQMWSKDANLGDGSCVRMNYGGDMGWDSEDCSELKPFICIKHHNTLLRMLAVFCSTQCQKDLKLLQ